MEIHSLPVLASESSPSEEINSSLFLSGDTIQSLPTAVSFVCQEEESHSPASPVPRSLPHWVSLDGGGSSFFHCYDATEWNFPPPNE